MSEYTPTTEEVRRQFSESLIYEKEYREVFDRWLVQERKRVAEMAIKKERRRAMTIIMANIGKIVWQIKQGTDSIDMSEIYNEIMGKDNEDNN